MTSTLLKKVERFRYLVLLFAAVFGHAVANAQLTSDEINAAMASESPVSLTWTNDAENPWCITVNNNGVNELRTRNDLAIDDNNPFYTFKSTLKFEYSSEYKTFLSFEWGLYNPSDLTLSVIIDGEEKNSRKNSGSEKLSFVLDAGSHTVEFVSNGNHANTKSYPYLRGFVVGEYGPLESECLQEGSMPLTFVNESEYPWMALNGCITSKSADDADDTYSIISTTFTIDQPSLFSYEFKHGSGDQYGNSCTVYIDGKSYRYHLSSSWTSHRVVLYPGEHKVEFHQWSSNGSSYYTRLRNICLSQTWDEVTVANPGEFISSLAAVIGSKNLQDVRMVKVKGTIGSADWSGFKQLKGIVGIDLTGTVITAIPASAFSGLSSLSSVMMPESLTTIGESAFEKTNCYEIHFPAAVETIGNKAWDNGNLNYAVFPENSKLKTIGYGAFHKTNLFEFKMPDSVETLGSNNSYQDGLFGECANLSSLRLSNSIRSIPSYMCYGCKSLKEVQIPESVTYISNDAFNGSGLESVVIPKNVWGVGQSVFYDCSDLKEVTLNSYMTYLNQTFYNCKAIQTITIPSAVPPYVYDSYSDAFYKVSRTARVVVPSFAYNAYKADAYWCNFTNIESSEELAKSDFWSIHGPVTLNGNQLMSGTPSINVRSNGTLTIAPGAAQDFNEVIFSDENHTECYINNGGTVTAKKLNSRYYVANAFSWYFFAPVADIKMSDISFSTDAAWVIRYYDGARRASENSNKGNWIDMPADGVLKRGQGYILQTTGSGWLELPAADSEISKFLSMEEATLSLADNECENSANAGWNFIGNPYAAYYDIAKMNLQAPITVWNGKTYTAYSLSDDAYALPPLTPFFVQKYNTELGIGMSKAGCQTTSTVQQSAAAPRPESADSHRQVLNLEIAAEGGEEAEDRTRIVVNETASLSYERACDAAKFMSMDAAVAQIYSFGEGSGEMAINERPYADGNVALGVYLPEAGKTYRISASRADRRAWLYDAATGIEQDLTEGDYIFAASKTGAVDNRFSIRFAPTSTNAADAIASEAVKVAGGHGTLTVTAPAYAETAVYAADGAAVAYVKGSAALQVAPGVYLVKVNGQSFKTIVK